MTVYFEWVGSTNLTESAEGTVLDMTSGLGYALTDTLELRAGYRFPLYRPAVLDSQFIVSAVRHF